MWKELLLVLGAEVSSPPLDSSSDSPSEDVLGRVLSPWASTPHLLIILMAGILSFLPKAVHRKAKPPRDLGHHRVTSSLIVQLASWT